MNAITTTDDKPTHDEVIRVLENSLYPGAKRESIELVLPCAAPTASIPCCAECASFLSVKKSDGTWETRDLLMPDIADYRIKAARSGEVWHGKSEPEFGHDVREAFAGVAITCSAWCRMTVRRIVQGQAREFVANRALAGELRHGEARHPGAECDVEEAALWSTRLGGRGTGAAHSDSRVLRRLHDGGDAG